MSVYFNALTHDIIAAIRVKQWIKNLLIPVVGIIMLGPLSEMGKAAVDLMAAFVAFCIAASSIYLLNDMMDISKDRAHPVKCKRPIASGRLGLSVLSYVLAISFPCAILLAWWVGPEVGILLMVYLAINVGYSTKLKHVPQLDIVCVASGFTIRALTGAFAVGHTMDFWLLAAITFACMGLALMKRMKELKTLGTSAQTRPVLAKYNYETLLRAHDMFMVLAILSVTMFLEHTTKVRGNPITVAAGLIFISAMFLIFIHRVQGDVDGDPTAFIYRNKILSISVVLATLSLSFFLM